MDAVALALVVSSAQRTGKVLLFVLWAAFAAVAYNIFSEVRELALIDDLELLEQTAPYEVADEATLARISANDERQVRAGAGYLVAVGTLIVLLLWVSRANRACRHLGASEMRFTPGWAWDTGWFRSLTSSARSRRIASPPPLLSRRS